MYVCLIKYHKKGKSYLFDCTNLQSKIKVGMKVVCDNIGGTYKGIVSSSSVYIDDSDIENRIKELFQDTGATFPLKQILQIEGRNIKLSNIKITKEFKNTSPNPIKIEKCVDYYKKNNKLDKPIMLNSKSYLIDGYIRYIVAKMFGIEKVQVIYNH